MTNNKVIGEQRLLHHMFPEEHSHPDPQHSCLIGDGMCKGFDKDEFEGHPWKRRTKSND